MTDTQSNEVWSKTAFDPSAVDDPACFSSNGDQIVIARRGSNYLVDLGTRKQCDIVGGHVCCVADGGGIVGTVSRDDNLRSMNIVGSRDGHTLCALPHQQRVSTAEFSPDGQTAATATSDGTIHLWNVPTGEKVVQFDTRAEHILKLQFSADGRQLAAVLLDDPEPHDGGLCGTVRICVWDGSDGP